MKYAFKHQRRGTLMLMTLLLASCINAPSATLPDLTFENVAPIPLDVATIEVSNQYMPPMHAPNIEHLLKPTPAAAVERLVGKELAAVGMTRTLRVIIEDASVVNETLPTSDAFWSVFSQEPSNKYKAKITLRFQLFDDSAPDIVNGRAEVTALRETIIMKSASPAERDRAALALTEALMKDVSAGLKTTVKETFGKR